MFNTENNTVNASQNGRNGHGHKCAVLFTHNLAQTEWIPINCDSKLLSHVICHVRLLSADDTGTELWPPSKSCVPHSILMEDLCHHFVWQSTNQKAKCLGNVSSISLVEAENLFSLVFQSTGLKRVQFKLCDNHVVLVYVEWLNIETKLKNDNEGFVVCTSSPRETNFTGLYFLSTENNTMISSVFCDTSVEATCLEESRQIQHNETLSCSSLYYLSVDGKCKGFLYQTTREKTHLTEGNKWANDSTTDWQNIKDNHRKNMGHKFCKGTSRLSCEETGGKCFHVADICVYKLDTNSALSPCTTGFHIQRCAHYKCHMHLKCPYYYCTLWSYVCDGKWDCPFGFDESPKQSCKRSSRCKNMFKCYRSLKCIHIQQICDKYFDCPFFDDEYLCNLQTEQCIRGCQCLFYAMSCSNISLTHHFQISLPFVSYHITFSEFIGTSLSLHLETLRVNFSHNNLSSIPVVLHNLRMLFSLDLSCNSLSTLEPYAFKQMHPLHSAFFKNNKISRIESKTFSSQKNLSILNVENNIISDLGDNIFNSILCLLILFISNNTLPKNVIVKFQLAQVSVKSLVTDSTALCCFAANVYTCFQSSDMKMHCGHLLKSFDTVIIVCQVVMTILNVSLLTVNFISSASEKKLNPYTITLNTLPMTYLFVNICFVLHLSYNSKYGEDYVYYVEEWQDSFYCRLSTHILLMYSTLVLCGHSFLSFSRMRVVTNPVESKFKKPKFVSLCLSAIFFVSLLIALGVSLALRNSLIPGVLCSPYDDPTKSLLVTHVVVIFLLVSQAFSLLLITVCFVLLIRGLKLSQKAAGTSSIKNHISILSQLIVLVVLHFCAWIPPSNIFLVCLHLSRYHPDLPAWALLIGLCLDTFGDPIVFLCVSFKAHLKKNKNNSGQVKK